MQRALSQSAGIDTAGVARGARGGVVSVSIPQERRAARVESKCRYRYRRSGAGRAWGCCVGNDTAGARERGVNSRKRFYLACRGTRWGGTAVTRTFTISSSLLTSCTW